MDSRIILERALASTSADHVTATYQETVEASTRFANNVITQNVAHRRASLNVTVAFDNWVGSASSNDCSEEGIRATVSQAEAIARESSPDPEFLPPVEGPQTYPSGGALCFPETLAMTPDEAAIVVVEAIRRAEKAGMRLAGSFTRHYSKTALMNNRGLWVESEETWARYVNTAVASDSSGWATRASRNARHVDVAGAVEIAVRKAEQSAHPREIPPGKYTVILEPDATADLLSCFYDVLDAKAAHEGRSCLSGKEGMCIAQSDVTISSLPTHPLCGGTPFIEGGLPAPDVHWIRNGTLENLRYSRYWAEKTNHPVTQPVNFIMEGGAQSLEELIASTAQGILVTRFWYIRFVDPMTFLLTGMTRDGLFWVEEGKIQYGLKNLRFNDSPLRVLNAIEGMGPSVLTDSPTVVPAIKVREFHFTSGTTF